MSDCGGSRDVRMTDSSQKEKSPESFNRGFGTRAKSAENLWVSVYYCSGNATVYRR